VQIPSNVVSGVFTKSAFSDPAAVLLTGCAEISGSDLGEALAF
jgi:hypothetical protein